MGQQTATVGIGKGDILAGKYRIEKILGQGGMGVVVAAHHVDLDERVAIKFLLPESLGNPQVVARFAREARAAVKIKNEHVARVSDVGRLETGAPYMVMEFLEGSDLSEWLKERGPLAVEQAVDFVLQACEALAEAHSLGIVHRDLKPANLFVIHRPDGSLSVKVLDFGISKVMEGSAGGPQAQLTNTAAILGSPLYMSPEQLQETKTVDARSDIWSMGVVLYELLSGGCPFTGETLPAAIAQILTVPPRPLSERLSHIPHELDGVIARCLEKDRQQRFPSVAELAEALSPYAPGNSRISLNRIVGVLRPGERVSEAPVPGPSAARSVAAVSGPGMGSATAAPWSRTHSPRAQARLAVLGVVAMGIVAALALWHFRSGAVADPPTTDGSAAPQESAVAPAPTVATKPVVEPAPSSGVETPAPSVSPAAASQAATSASDQAPPHADSTLARPAQPKASPKSPRRTKVREVAQPKPPETRPPLKPSSAFDDRK